MKLHLVQAKDEATDWETEEPEDGWGGKASCALVLYTKTEGPHCAHFEVILLALYSLQGFRKILFLVVKTKTQARFW